MEITNKDFKNAIKEISNPEREYGTRTYTSDGRGRGCVFLLVFLTLGVVVLLV